MMGKICTEKKFCKCIVIGYHPVDNSNAYKEKIVFVGAQSKYICKI
jgi:hypothetical protein